MPRSRSSAPNTPPPICLEGLFRVGAAAAWLDCSRTTVYDLCRRGELPFVEIGIGRGDMRVPKSALVAYAENRVRRHGKGEAA